MKYTNVKNLQYTESGMINMLVNFEGIGEVPFTASSDDTEAHGVELYTKAIAGDFGEIAPYVPPVVSQEELLAQIQREKTLLVHQHMDSVAQQYGYDNITTAVTYADEPAVPKFQDEGIAFRAWRSLVWDVGYQIIAEVLQGTREVPTDEEIIAELPEFTVTYRNQGG